MPIADNLRVPIGGMYPAGPAGAANTSVGFVTKDGDDLWGIYVNPDGGGNLYLSHCPGPGSP
jgi:hypothetical protein